MASWCDLWPSRVSIHPPHVPISSEKGNGNRAEIHRRTWMKAKWKWRYSKYPPHFLFKRVAWEAEEQNRIQIWSQVICGSRKATTSREMSNLHATPRNGSSTPSSLKHPQSVLANSMSSDEASCLAKRQFPHLWNGDNIKSVEKPQRSSLSSPVTFSSLITHQTLIFT